MPESFHFIGMIKIALKEVFELWSKKAFMQFIQHNEVRSLKYNMTARPWANESVTLYFNTSRERIWYNTLCFICLNEQRSTFWYIFDRPLLFGYAFLTRIWRIGEKYPKTFPNHYSTVHLLQDHISAYVLQAFTSCIVIYFEIGMW